MKDEKTTLTCRFFFPHILYILTFSLTSECLDHVEMHLLNTTSVQLAKGKQLEKIMHVDIFFLISSYQKWALFSIRGTFNDHQKSLT